MKTTRNFIPVILVFLMAACGRTFPASVDLSEESESTSAAQPDPQYTDAAQKNAEEAVFINDIQILNSESAETVEVEINGSYPDGCTRLDEIVHEKQETEISIRLTTKRPEDAACTMALEPFTINIPLKEYDLDEGEIYRVVVYEHAVDFIIGEMASSTTEGG